MDLIVKIAQRANLKLVFVLITIFSPAESAYCVTQYKKARHPYIKDLNEFKTSITLDSKETHVSLTMPHDKVMKRILNSKEDERIESLHLNLFKDPAKLKDLSIDLSKKGQNHKLLTYFNKLMQSPDAEDYDDYRRVPLTAESLKYIDTKKLAQIHAQDHKVVKINVSPLRRSKKKRDEFISQLKPFLEARELQKVEYKIKNNLNLDMQEDLLSGFARDMTGKYTIFKGPNCFHAALAFHTREISDSPFINVKIEEGYHRAMINYDELWKAINLYFYEISPSQTPLKYGDLIVFMDVPDDGKEPYFKWIRHAATYLFGQYTFSKGSKSPNSPYSIKTLQDEWMTWQGYSRNLRVKVFRRNQNHVNKRPPRDLTDWIY